MPSVTDHATVGRTMTMTNLLKKTRRKRRTVYRSAKAGPHRLPVDLPEVPAVELADRVGGRGRCSPQLANESVSYNLHPAIRPHRAESSWRKTILVNSRRQKTRLWIRRRKKGSYRVSHFSPPGHPPRKGRNVARSRNWLR